MSKKTYFREFENERAAESWMRMKNQVARDEQRKKDDTKHAPERLFLVHAVLALSRSFKSRVVDNALIVFYEGRRETREIPDFALDRHTQRGRRLKRGWDHFFTEGVGSNIQPDAVYEVRAREIRRDNRLELEG